MKLLSIDWDYFFPMLEEDGSALYDWGHREVTLYIDGPLWPMRAGAFMRQGLDLPGVNDHWTGFWDRFRFAEGAQLYFGESHSWAADQRVTEGITGLWSYDAHHDCGYHPEDLTLAMTQGRYDCGSWVLCYWPQIADVRTHWDDPLDIHVRYPGWKDWRSAEESCSIFDVDRATDLMGEETPVFDRVFVCRSGAWVPPWCDLDYEKFVEGCPLVDRVDLGPELGWPSTPRVWDENLALEHATLVDRLTREQAAAADTTGRNFGLSRGGSIRYALRNS